MRRWIEDIINFAFPAECHVCESKLGPNEKFICQGCISKFPLTGYHRIDLNPMEERFAGLFPFEKGTSLYFYSKGSQLSQLIQDMKYRNYPSIGEVFGKLAYRELFSTGFFSGIDHIVPVPMHWFKKARRGYNQTEMIGKGLSRESGIPLTDALKMTRRHTTQTKLSRKERIKNAEGLFKTKKGFDLTNKGVLLIDDVCTTGTTLASAAKALHERAPGIKLSLLTIGVTY